jgi:hypothetical protein
VSIGILAEMPCIILSKYIPEKSHTFHIVEPNKLRLLPPTCIFWYFELLWAWLLQVPGTGLIGLKMVMLKCIEIVEAVAYSQRDV